ncbi:MAG: cytochrome C [Desulfobulbaceae bacterium]|nr:cytochrome C [Desulfobulbaceae bacterium]
MKKPVNKLLVVALLSIAVVGFATFSQASISGSKHDFSQAGWSGGQICLPCHAPHDGVNVANAPLWNHELSTATYTLYSSPTLDAVPGQPGGASKLCLSCHDGTVAIDSFGGKTGNITLSGSVGTDLSDDHPISFVYDAALAVADGGLHDPTVRLSGIPGAAGTIDQDMLFSGSLECASCHDVHNANDTGGDLLIKSNEGSALCLTCHNS